MTFIFLVDLNKQPTAHFAFSGLTATSNLNFCLDTAQTQSILQLKSLASHAALSSFNKQVRVFPGRKATAHENGSGKRGGTVSSKECEHIPQNSSSATAVFIMSDS